VTDALSRYYESDQWDKQQNAAQYVNADSRLDPEGEDLPWARFEENRAMSTPHDDALMASCPRRQQCAPKRPDEDVSFAPKRKIIKAVEPHQSEAAELAVYKEPILQPQRKELPLKESQDDPRVIDSLDHHPDLCLRIEGDKTFLKDIKDGYHKDLLFSKMLKKIRHYKNFEIIDDLLYTHNLARDRILCIPAVIHNK
jgi:hypothetical protein